MGACSFYGEHTQNVLIVTPAQNAPEESKHFGHKHCINTPPSTKHRGNVCPAHARRMPGAPPLY